MDASRVGVDHRPSLRQGLDVVLNQAALEAAFGRLLEIHACFGGHNYY
jgi:hypothetical protein